MIPFHCGRKKLYAKIRTKYYWKNMTKDVTNFVKHCNVCSLSKVKHGHKEKLVLTPIPVKAFEIVIMDTIGPLAETKIFLLLITMSSWYYRAKSSSFQ